MQPEPDALLRLFGSAAQIAGTFLGTLVVGALLLAFAPDFTERIMDTAEDEPVTSFLWGLGIFLALIVVTVVLVITIVGIVLAIPLLIVMFVLYLVGSAIVFILVGERLAAAGDVDTSRWGHLVVGALVAAVLAAIPFVGGLVNFVVNSVGVGAIAYRWRSGA
jgi:hypothetical protein